MACILNNIFPNTRYKKLPCPSNTINDVSVFITDNQPPIYNGPSILRLYETALYIQYYIPGPYQGVLFNDY
jgi:hypothetical protein